MKQVTQKTYNNVHLWLAEKFGKAVACENPECKGTSTLFQYALRAGKTHKRLRSNYMTLCRTCHSAYDAKHKNKGHISNPVNRLSMKLLWKLYAQFQEKELLASHFLFLIDLKGDEEKQRVKEYLDSKKLTKAA